jgi:two-component system, OmpR family, phosphate regulon sensor histidine kinase PhoR
VDPWPLIAIAASAGFLVAVVQLRRSRDVARLTRAAVRAAPSADLPTVVAGLRDEADRLRSDLAEERRDRDALVESLAEGLIGLDHRLRIIYANGPAHVLLGVAPGALIGRSVTEAFLDVQAEAIARSAADGGSSTGEIRLGTPDGPKLVLRARRAGSGGLWLVLEDVSELRRLQQIRAEFIDNLSHELRTPLTTVSLLAETLAREATTAGTRVPAKMRDRISKIEVETGHLVQMVNELLDLSRIESGGSLGVIDSLDMGQLAVASVERLRLFADRQGVTLRTVVEAPVPQIRGDESRLGQVIVNLVHNAVKFSPDGGDVAILVTSTDEDVITSVVDHGVGIPRAAQDRIFERFYKVDRARVRGEASGTGLGLAIARHVIEQHHGRIWVESDEGVGSTFAFAIPIHADLELT